MSLYRCGFLAIALLGVAACDGEHPLHERTTVPIMDAAPHSAAVALALSDGWYCEPVAEAVFVPLRVAVGTGGHSATAARVSGDRCLLLVDAPTTAVERPLPGASVVFKRAGVPVTNLIAPQYHQFADCQPASQFRVVDHCPADAVALP